jgi:hypothetical protein
LTSRSRCVGIRRAPTTPHAQRTQALTRTGFRLFPFRSPLLRESHPRQRRGFPRMRDSFSFPRGTEMFHFSRCAFAELFDSPGDVPPLNGTGFPIRKSSDRSLLTAPRSLSQLHHVLHRLLTPRHPPKALSSLTKTISSGLRNPRPCGVLRSPPKAPFPRPQLANIQLSKSIESTTYF